jgi:hypothetical protein
MPSMKLWEIWRELFRDIHWKVARSYDAYFFFISQFQFAPRRSTNQILLLKMTNFGVLIRYTGILYDFRYLFNSTSHVSNAKRVDNELQVESEFWSR